MTDLISRLAAGERWDGDNAEVLRARGWKQRRAFGWEKAGAVLPFNAAPLDDMNIALALKDPSDRLSLVEGDDGCHAHLSRQATAGWRLFEGDAPTLRAALCIAILRAGESR